MDAIQFENVSKQYRLGLVGTGTLAHDIRRFFITNILRKEDPYLKIGETNDRTSKGNSDYVWALRDITFNVEQGDVVGIIGKNGAGKSTLLKLLSRVTGPTTGTIRAHGRIGSLLEVGTGFHPEMTGRENIFMNGAILGMTKREIQAKLDEIIDFSGCERYIDTPVKRYSSGMMVRLGFAVAAHLDPEILVVDEVLAVGDAEFQKKAIGKMQDVSKGEGRTVLFVSHNMNSVKMLCNHGIILENGSVKYTGTAEECVSRYLSSEFLNFNTDVVFTDKHRRDNNVFRRNVEFVKAHFLNEHPDSMATDEPIRVHITMKKNDANIKEFQCNTIISNTEGEQIAFFLSDKVDVSKAKNTFDFELTIPRPSLPRGIYVLRFEASIQGFSTGVTPFDYVFDALSFQIKYIHKALQDEYLLWQSSWGLNVHEGDEININLIK